MALGSNDFNPFEYYHARADDIIDDAQGGIGGAPTGESGTGTGSHYSTDRKRKQTSMVWEHFDRIEKTIEGKLIRF